MSVHKATWSAPECWQLGRLNMATQAAQWGCPGAGLPAMRLRPCVPLAPWGATATKGRAPAGKQPNESRRLRRQACILLPRVPFWLSGACREDRDTSEWLKDALTARLLAASADVTVGARAARIAFSAVDKCEGSSSVVYVRGKVRKPAQCSARPSLSSKRLRLGSGPARREKAATAQTQFSFANPCRPSPASRSSSRPRFPSRRLTTRRLFWARAPCQRMRCAIMTGSTLTWPCGPAPRLAPGLRRAIASAPPASPRTLSLSPCALPLTRWRPCE